MADTTIKITAEDQASATLNRVNSGLGNLEKSTDSAEKGMRELGNTAKMAIGALGALTAGLGVAAIVDYTARWTDLNSRLINATGSQEAASQALDAISRSARGTYSSLEDTAKVFVRNSMVLNELGYTTNEQIKITEALNNAIAVSGARGPEAASALDAFAQAIGRGKMEGEDFNRLIENSPRIVKALADGLGVTTGEFRKMITEGKISSDVMIPALLSQMKQLQGEAEAMPATISDAFIVLQNSLFEFIGSTDQALGISQALSRALVFLADNTGILVGGIAGLTVAVAALAAPLVIAALSVATITGGLAVAGAVALGAAFGYAAQQAGLFAKNTKDQVDPAQQAALAAQDAAAAEARKAAAAKKSTEEQQKAARALRDSLGNLEQQVQYQENLLALGESEANVRKMIVEEQKKLAEVGLRLTQKDEQRIRAAFVRLQQIKEEKILQDALRTLHTEIIGLLVQDRNQREIILAIRQQELDLGRSMTDHERERLTATIQVAQSLRQQQKFTESLTELHTEIIGLLIEDKDQREIILAIRQQELAIGRALTTEETEQLTVTTQKLQALRQERALKDAISEATREQTELEKIQRGLGLQRTVGGGINTGFVTSQEEYRKDQEALQSLLQNKIISEQQYFQQREELARQYNTRVQELELARIQRVLMAERGATAAVMSDQDRAVLQRVGAEERQRAIVTQRIEFEKKSEAEKYAFGIDQAAQMFSALGAQNKKAFEAAKAFNIANAIMNTYMAATKALATYPPPFSFIAAAAAVAMGLAQVSTIRNQQYSGRALGGPVMGGESYIVGENGPELFTPATSGGITRNDQLGSGGTTNVTFQIIANDTAGFDQLLTSRRGLITQIISDAQLERGRRA